EAPCVVGREAFEKTVYSYIRDSNRCVRCHRDQGPGPSFASDDVNTSYARLKRLANPQDPAKSTFVLFGGNDHCGCGVTPELLKNLVDDWWTGGENQCPQPGRYLSDVVPIPELGKAQSGWTELKIPLNRILDSLSGAYFQVEVENFADP